MALRVRRSTIVAAVIIVIMIAASWVTKSHRVRLMSVEGRNRHFWLDSYEGMLFWTYGTGGRHEVWYNSSAFGLTGGILEDEFHGGYSRTVAVSYLLLVIGIVAG